MIKKKQSPAGEAGRELKNEDTYNLPSATAKDKFLDLFPPKRRSQVTNEFCCAVRAGYVDPYSIVTSVLCALTRKRDHELYDAIRANYEAGLEFAEYILAWEKLPAEVKRKIKEERASVHREEYLRTQPPTDKQLKYLKVLGYKREVKSKWEAMTLIDKLTGK